MLHVIKLYMQSGSNNYKVLKQNKEIRILETGIISSSNIIDAVYPFYKCFKLVCISITWKWAFEYLVTVLHNL